jgi:hypothetical protein
MNALSESPKRPSTHERLLLARIEVLSILQLSDEQVQFLINTRQLLPISNRG